jgi:hypothetical protein
MVQHKKGSQLKGIAKTSRIEGIPPRAQLLSTHIDLQGIFWKPQGASKMSQTEGIPPEPTENSAQHEYTNMPLISVKSH